MDPAVGVHGAARDAFDNAIDGISDVLARCDQEGGQDEGDHGALVVQPEDVVVDPYLVQLQESLKLWEHPQHLERFCCWDLLLLFGNCNYFLCVFKKVLT